MRGNNDQLAEIVVNTNDNGIHYNGHLVMPFIQVNAEDIIYLKIMASRGGTLNTYGDANKIKTYLCLETID